MFRRIGRAFKEAFWGITHHFAMAFSTSNAVTITLILVCVFTCLVTNVSQITYDVESDIQIYAPIQNSVAEEDLDSLKAKILKVPGVGEVVYSSKDDELNSLIDSFGEDGNIFEIYRQDNPLPRAFLISVENGYTFSQVTAQLEKIEGLDNITYGGSSVENFVSLMDGIRKVGYTFTLALTVLAIFLIHNTIRITINSRKEEIGIMRLCGATNSYIVAPLVLEGIFIGIMGSIIPICMTIFGYKYIYESLNGQLISGIMKLIPTYPFVLYVSGFALIIGVLVGLIGSMISARKYLRVKRWKNFLKLLNCWLYLRY